MRKVLGILIVAALFSGCSNSGNGELIGIQKRPKFYQPDPYGMVYVPMGSYTMGIGSEDVPMANLREPKTVTITAFYMDETEITNNEYRQFVYWVRDSIARRYLSQLHPDPEEAQEFLVGDPNAANYDPTTAPLNWEKEIDWEDEQVAEVIENQTNLLIPQAERFFRKKEVDARQLNYDYFWIDLQGAARKDYSNPDPKMGMFGNRAQVQRSSLIKKDKINVYPDTLCWMHDFTYTHNSPLAQRYFWHPAYDHYPVVGVNWKQARAFGIWRTQLQSAYLRSQDKAESHEFRLPTEAEWEWAARGGYEGNPYPWGGLILEMPKVVSWPISNPCGAIMWMMAADLRLL